MIQKSLKVNTASGTTLGPIGITSLELNIDDQICVHNFIICTKLKQPLIMGLNFAQRYQIGMDWDMYGTSFLRHEGKNIDISMKTTNPDQWTIAFLETSSENHKDMWEIMFNDQPHCYYTTQPHFYSSIEIDQQWTQH